MRWLLLIVTVFSTSIANAQDWAAVPFGTFTGLQAVNTSTGAPLFSNGSFPLRYRGVVLNNPADMLNSTPNFIPWVEPNPPVFALGGQWQIFVQSVSGADKGGAALFMAQNYGNFPNVGNSNGSYQNSEWTAELNRITSNGILKAGDYIEVRARTGLPFGGKFNINESHNKAAQNDFEIIILDPNDNPFKNNPGQLPLPIPVALGALKSSPTTFNFPSTEQYQAQLVSFSNVSIVDPQNWAPNGKLTLTDGTNTFPLHLGINPAFGSTTAPVGPFNVTGIFNQEATAANTDGYELWVMNPANFVAVPEPASLLLAAVGVLSLFTLKRRCAA